MNLLLTSILFFFILLLGLIPFFLLYPLSRFISWILYRVVGYRKKVVVTNLSSAFPEMDKKELEKLVKNSYRNLSDILLEGIKGFTMTRKQIMQRHKVLNADLLDPFISAGKSFIAVPTHYGNWEWGALSAALYLKDYKVVAFYKPLNNPYADRFMSRNRSRTGTELASIYKTSSTFETFRHVPTLYIMAADQSPSNMKTAIWVDFLGIKTAFLHGPEKHAVTNDLPVFFVDIQRVKRGYYTLKFSLISDHPSDTEPGEITRRYAKKLEEVIRKKPENWLWTHKRWKLNN